MSVLSKRNHNRRWNEAKVLQGWVSSVSTLLLSGNKKLSHERSVTRRHRRETPAPDGIITATSNTDECFQYTCNIPPLKARK